MMREPAEEQDRDGLPSRKRIGAGRVLAGVQSSPLRPAQPETERADTAKAASNAETAFDN
jgi:hypothetical protein